jgi:hypothetical protein
MSTYIVTNPFTSVSGAHQPGAVIMNAVEIATILSADDATFMVHGADPSPTLNVLTFVGMMG